ISTCPRASAGIINTSPKRASNICAVLATMAALLPSTLPSDNTSPVTSIAKTATANAMYDFDKHLAALSEQTLLCIGDLMLDEFVYGEVSRISPEAPTPVIAVKRTEVMIGGAGQVSRKLAALGSRFIFCGALSGGDAWRGLT